MKYVVNKRNFIILFLAATFNYIGSFMTESLLSVYSKQLGATDVLVGMVSGVFYAVALLTRPFTGTAMDCFSRKKLFIIFSLGNMLALLGYSMSTNIWMIIAFRALQGCTYGAVAALTLVMSAETLDQEHLTSGVAAFAMSQIFPRLIGPGLGLKLSENYGFRTLYISAAAIVAAGIILTMFLKEEPREYSKFKLSMSSVIAMEAIVPITALLIMNFCVSATTSFMMLHINERAIPNVEYYFVVSSVAMLVFRPLFGTLADRFGTEKVVIVTLLSLFVAMNIFARAHTFMDLVIYGIFNSIGYSATVSLLQALVMKVTPPERRGAASSSSYIGSDVGLVLGNLINGSIAARYGYQTLFTAFSIPLFLAIAVIAVWAKKGMPVAESTEK
ncbi:MAG: MFS transporter [Oscillospiraceae bacterium]|nr:MFS transporter [Oscillospiraceae bacterium]